MRLLLISLLLSLCLGTAAKADTLGAGPILGKPAQHTVDCFLFNLGGSAVSVSSVTIYDETGATVAPYSSTCSSLGPHKTCYALAIAGFHWYSCRAVVGNKTNIRGTLEIRDTDGAVLNDVDLR